jgi:hypothetical protein
MKTVLPVLTAAAFVLFAGPAFAGHSTPKEREATRQLNLEAAQQAKSTNQQIAAANTDANRQTQSAPAPVDSSPAQGQIQDQPASPADNSPANPGANAPAQ